jgi:hypothetical protein
VNGQFKPGDKVIWWKRNPGGDYVYPVGATVLGTTTKRVKIEADDEGQIVIRNVKPESLQRQTPVRHGDADMQKVERDEIREEHIHMEIMVDAYGPEEHALSWYYYLEENLNFPFKARCIAERRTSPLKVGEEVEVSQMLPEDECEHDMFVEIGWEGRTLGVPLSQLEAIDVDEQTQEAMDYWHYWTARGYEF